MNKRILSRLKYFATPLRRKPDYLILGAQKSGTSTLFQLLSDHPDIHNPYTKELHYFDWHYNHTFFWYRSHFPINRGKITGEATPIYLFHPEIPLRVKTHLPNTKFIVILRNPVDRAYAHYQMTVRKKLESLSFEEAIKAEPERMNDALKQMKNSNSDYSLALQRYSYLSRGQYHEQLQRWLAVFPRSQFHILSFEEFIIDAQHEYNRICTFLSLPFTNSDLLPKLNADKYKEMHHETRSFLNDYFESYNSKLFELTGSIFPWKA